MKLFKRTLLAAIVALSASAAHAGIVTFNLNGGINGTPPSNVSNPTWLSATLTDIETGKVELIMASTLPAGEYVDSWLFNVASSVTGLSAIHSAGYEWGSFVFQQTNGSNAIKAGTFDLGFGSDNANASRFPGKGTSTYEFSGTGLSTASFLVLSAKDGNNILGGYYSAADVKGIDNGKSGSIGAAAYTLTDTTSPVVPVKPVDAASIDPAPSTAVPEPGAIALLGIGLLGLMLKRRQR